LIYPGCSGAPVFSYRSKAVIGIVIGSTTGDEIAGIAIGSIPSNVPEQMVKKGEQDSVRLALSLPRRNPDFGLAIPLDSVFKGWRELDVQIERRGGTWPMAPGPEAMRAAQPGNVESAGTAQRAQWPDSRLVPATHPFRMASELISNRLYDRFIQQCPDWGKDGECKANGTVDRHYLQHWTSAGFSPDHPVQYVSVHAANAFLRWLGEKLRKKLRLPAADEWRAAAEGGRTGSQWWDEDLHQNRVNCLETKGAISTVWEFEPNDYGINDILGNLRDMCKGTDEFLALGGWYLSPRSRLLEKSPLSPTECREDVGFRFVMDP
jgi:hypothetical protein